MNGLGGGGTFLGKGLRYNKIKPVLAGQNLQIIRRRSLALDAQILAQFTGNHFFPTFFFLFPWKSQVKCCNESVENLGGGSRCSSCGLEKCFSY